MYRIEKEHVQEEARKLLQQENEERFYEGLEWLETNGLGGWSGSSVIGCNTRRYHGLLVAATKPPTERMNLVSRLDETIIVDGKRIELAVNNYGNVISPEGYTYISSFERNIFPSWKYEAEGIVLKKTIAMIHEQNTVVVFYEVVDAAKDFVIEFLPLIAARGCHSLQHSYTNMWWDVHFENGIFKNKPHENAPEFFISVPGSSYTHSPKWFYNFNYSVEHYRGLDFTEDLFNHGVISVSLKNGDVLPVIISTEDVINVSGLALFEQEKKRRKALIQSQKNELVQRLALAADQFIVKRDEDLKTIIAGYHWFTDWGRDTMISLPGLCLSTGRFDDAKKILSAFAKNVSMGMLPNRFQDNNEPPEYNNVDGTLWYFIAVYKYLQASDDTSFVLNEILPVLKEIIDWHFKGTRYNIHVTEDGLLFAGEKGQQLTWMDARVGDWVVTPRMGKPVEIQALWYNALKIFAELLRMNYEERDASDMEEKAAKAKVSFENIFWYAEGGYLFDVIDETGDADATLRPNQLFAISLPYALVSGRKAQSIITIIREKLYTCAGLRTLPEEDPRYIPEYGGNALKRDGSYHQGTAWSWLIGAYIEAIFKIENDKEQLSSILSVFSEQLERGCVGSISEIFDASAPHFTRGCVAQAWGVAEVLRVVNEYSL